MEEVANGAVEEIAVPQTEVQDVVQDKPQVDDQQERNWRAIRERQKDLERELKLQREMNERLLQMSQTPPAPVEKDELDALGDDEYIPIGKVKKLVQREAQKIAKEIAQEETKSHFQRQEQSQFLSKLRSQFSDYDEIVNPETLSLLEQQDPDLANSIAEQKDPYKIGLQTYKFIKANGIQGKVSQSRRSREIDEKLEKNAQTVQSPQAYDKRPMAQAFKTSKAEMSQIYDEMMQCASQAGFSY